MSMKVDMRIHPQIREQVHAGISALRVQGRQILGVHATHAARDRTATVVRLCVYSRFTSRISRRASRRHSSRSPSR